MKKYKFDDSEMRLLGDEALLDALIYKAQLSASCNTSQEIEAAKKELLRRLQGRFYEGTDVIEAPGRKGRFRP